MLRKLVFFFFFLLGVGIVFGYRMWQVQKLTHEQFIPQKVTFTQQPPAVAVSGNILHVQGEIKKQGRDDDDFKPLNSDTTIVQGDTVATGKAGSATISLQNFGNIMLDTDTEIGFVDLIPSEFLLKQNSGNVVYQTTDNSKSISVRAMHALVVGSGTFTITFDKQSPQATTMQAGSLQVISGNAKIAMVDNDNNTKILSVQKGQKVVIDDESRAMK